MAEPLLNELTGGGKQPKRSYDLTLERISQNRLNPQKIREQLVYIRDAVSRNKSRRFKGILAKAVPEPVAFSQAGQGSYRYTTKLRVRNESGTTNKDRLKQQLEEVTRVVAAAARSSGWRIVSEDEQAAAVRNEGVNPNTLAAKQEHLANVIHTIDNVQLPELTADAMESFFGRIYQRSNHINIIHRANVTAAMTRFEKRRHSLLWGPPSCAKTELFDCFVSFYGPENVLHLDVTTTTKAGLESLILKKALEGKLPPFLYLEEIEKYDLTTLHCLHAIMDQRGRIQRTNARVGNMIAEAKTVVWATCNSLKKLREFEGGAILSRFSNRKQLYSPRPDEELMRRILLREVTEMGGEEAWVDPVVRFVFDEMRTNDPREAVALLDGRELLLGEAPYLRWVRENIEAERRDRQLEREAEMIITNPETTLPNV